MARKEKFTSPTGAAVWPKLNEPDQYQENSTPNFNVKLALEGEEAEEFKLVVDEWVEQAVDEIMKEKKERNQKPLPKSQQILGPNLPYMPEIITDDEGEETETGRTLFKFKRNAVGKSRTGETFERKLPVFDAGQPPKPIFDEIWGGSTLRISYSPRYYYIPKMGCGVTLDMHAVQVLDLVGAEGNSNPSAFGFEGDEDGFVGTHDAPADGLAPEQNSSTAAGHDDAEF